MKRRVILVGPPGCGKGTTAKELQAQFELVHLSSGQLLREEAGRESDLGRKVELFLENGELVPDQIIHVLVRQWLPEPVLDQGFLLDGIPRTLGQARQLDDWLLKKGASAQAVLFFQCPEEVLLERISGRRVCPACGKGYHVRFIPPRVSGECDNCGSQLVQREDDTEAVARWRLAVYRRLTEPLVEYYEQRRIVSMIDAGQPAEKVLAEAINALKE